MPATDAHPSKVARWYRDVLGWLVFPTRGPKDIDGFAAFLLKQESRLFVDRKNRQPNEEERAKLQAETREEAERTAKASMQPWRSRDFITDHEVDSWWGGERGAARGIWVAMGRIDVRSLAAQYATPIMGIDVDPRSGGVESEWDSGAGPLARTPSGGVHLLHIADSAFPCSVGDAHGHGLSPGIDVRSSGGGIVVWSGSSSPGRSWERWEAPVKATEKMVKANASAKANPGTRSSEGHSGVDGSARTASTFAEILGVPAPDGTRNATAAQIVGVLARPQAIPEDSLDAALAMLFEAGEDDVDGWTSLLTRGPRGPEEAVAFLAAWNSTRGDPPWSDGRCERTARSLWKTSDRREEGNAGAEDLGYVPAWDASGVPEGATEPEPAEDAVDEEAPSPEVKEAIKFKAKAFEIPPGFALPLSQALPFESLLELTQTVPVSVAHGPKWKLWTGKDDTSAEFGYGLGTWFDSAVGGGINPGGSFWALGALTPKSGKTMFLGQLVEGLALTSALRLISGEDGWITPVFWLTEMVKHVDVGTRMIGRYLGLDISMWGRGIRGHEAPGIRHLAVKMGHSPEDAHKYMIECVRRLKGTEGPFIVASDLTTNIDPQALPRKRGGRHVENPRLGISLLQTVEQSIAIRCQQIADAWGVDPARIKPVLVADPVHRFIDSAGEDRLTAVNMVIGKLREIAYENKWIVLATSDTTKGGSGADKDMTGDVGTLANNAFAGSINLAHEPDTVIVLRADDQIPVVGSTITRRAVQVRVCYSRRGGLDTVLPYTWRTHCGQYLAEDPTVLVSQSQEPERAPSTKPNIQRKAGRPPKHR